jgi:hypothetical protein
MKKKNKQAHSLCNTRELKRKKKGNKPAKKAEKKAMSPLKGQGG